MRIYLAVMMMIATMLAASVLAVDGGAASSAVASMEQKLRHVESNGELPHPDSTPTEFTENEVNAYFAAGRMNFPAGVESVRFQSDPGVATATTRVDFDRLKGGSNSSNPVLTIFSGVHDVVVVAHAHGSGGQGLVHVDSVSLDDVEIPRFALQLFVQKFIQPRYPDLGLDSRFQLPDRIADATVEEHKLTVVQR
jgi:hypothetical protein